MHNTIIALKLKWKAAKEAAVRAEAARNVELILGHCETASLNEWSESNIGVFHAQRVAAQDLHKELDGLAWHLEQDREYY